MKWDGFRAVVWRTTDGVRIQSRQGVDPTRFFPDLVVPLADALPARTVLDGEVLVWDTQRGRSSFSLLQRRLTAGRRLPEIVRNIRPIWSRSACSATGGASRCSTSR